MTQCRQIEEFDRIHRNVRNRCEIIGDFIRSRHIIMFIDILNVSDDFLQIKISQERLVVLAILDTRRQIRIVSKEQMGEGTFSLLIQKRNRFLAIVTNNRMDFGIVEFATKILDGVFDFIFFGQCRARKHEFGYFVFFPIVLNGLVKRMFFIVHCNGWLVPIRYKGGFVVESEHIVHRCEIGFHITNHDFDVGADTVIHFVNAPGFVMDTIGTRREIMETDVRRGFTSESKRHLFMHRNRGFREGKTHMSRDTHKDDFMLFGEPDR